EIVLQEEHVQLGAAERAQLTRENEDDALGLGPIQRLLDDDEISEIMVSHPSQIFVERKGKLTLENESFSSEDQLRSVIERIVGERKGKLTLANESFSSEDQLRRVIERIVGKVGRRIDESSPLVDARLTDGSRVNAVIPPLAVRGSSLTIRKFAKKALSIQDL